MALQRHQVPINWPTYPTRTQPTSCHDFWWGLRRYCQYLQGNAKVKMSKTNVRNTESWVYSTAKRRYWSRGMRQGSAGPRDNYTNAKCRLQRRPHTQRHQIWEGDETADLLEHDAEKSDTHGEGRQHLTSTSINTQINSRRIIFPNVKVQTIRLWHNNIGEYFHNALEGKRLLPTTKS